MDWSKLMFATSAALFLITALLYVAYLWACLRYDAARSLSTVADAGSDLAYVHVKCSACGEKLGRVCLLVDIEGEETVLLCKLEVICNKCREARD